MGKIDSNFSRSKPQRQSSLLTNLIIPDSPKPTTNSTTSPSSPADEIFYDALEGFIDNVAEEVLDDVLEEVFYDALEDFGEDVELQLPDKPRLTNVLRTSIAFEHETASNTPSIPPLFPSTTSTSTFTTSVINTGFSRNSSKPTTSLTTRGNSSVLPFATQTQADFARSTAPIPISSSVPAPRSPQKKAVLIGLNYERCGKKDLRLRHATRDAWRFATTLTKLGYSKDNMKVVTDEEGQRFPSFDYLIECLDWLVQDVSDGDCLFFMFSGHCDPPKPGKPEPHLVAADLMAIPRSTFQEHLVTKVPAGAELTIVLDCCNAAGMVKLKYCIGRMGSRYEITRTDESRALSELGQSAVSPSRGAPQHGSLLGLKGLGQQARVHPQARPVEVGLGAYGTPASIPPRRNHHVATGRPLPITAPSQAPIPHVIIGSSPHSAPLRLPPAQRRQPVFEGRPQFKEPSAGLVSPAGKVVVWAGTGERQLAFEASGGVQNSVFSNAICDVLDTCPKSPVTHGDVWRSVVGAVDRENNWRSERDAKKAVKPAPNLRVQHAQLWVSQEEEPSSPSFLDQLVY